MAARNELLLKESAEVLHKYSVGQFRLALEDVGCAPFNRNGTGVNGRHAHSVVNQIVREQGLVQFMYRRGLVLEHDPVNPLAVATFTNAYVARQSDLLASVAIKPLYGSFAKTHLWHGLYTLKVGGKKFDGTDELMEVPRHHADDELKDTLQRGLVYEVLRFEAWQKHPHAVEALMAADNFDASQALADTEISLLLSYQKASHGIVVPDGVTHYAAVAGVVDRMMGTRWTEQEKASIYNFSKVVGAEQVDCLSVCHQQWVDPKTMRVDPSSLGLLAKLEPHLVWTRAAVVVANMLAVPEKQERRGTTFVGVTVSNADIKGWLLMTRGSFDSYEQFIREVLAKYDVDGLSGVSQNELVKAHSGFLARVGQALVKVRDHTGRGQLLQKAELRLREFVKKSAKQLPRPLLPDVAAEELKAANEATKKQTQLQTASHAHSSAKSTVPDLMPAISFDDSGAIVQDCPFRSRAKGIVLGGWVTIVGSTILGQVTAIEDDKLIVTAQNNTTHTCTPEELDLARPGKRPKLAEEAAPDQGAEQTPDEEDLRSEGIPWIHSSATTNEIALLDSVRAGLHKAYNLTCPPPTTIRIGANARDGVTVDEAVPAGALCLLPFTRDLSTACPEKRPPSTKFLEAQLQIGTTDWIPVFLTCETAPKVKGEPSEIVPFWRLQSQRVKQKDATLEYKFLDLLMPVSLSPVALNDDTLPKVAKKMTAKLSVRVRLPYLTNVCDLAVAAQMTVPGAPPAFE